MVRIKESDAYGPPRRQVNDGGSLERDGDGRREEEEDVEAPVIEDDVQKSADVVNYEVRLGLLSFLFTRSSVVS